MCYPTPAHRRLGTAIAALLTVGALAACSGGGDTDAVTTATVGTGPPPPPTSAPAPPDPYAIPDTVDVAYVEQTINKLYEIMGDADRLAMEQRSVPLEVNDRLAATNDPSITPIMINSMVNLALKGFEGMIDPPGNEVASVDEVIESTPTCIIALVDIDASRRRTEPIDYGPRILDLHRLDPANDPGGHNRRSGSSAAPRRPTAPGRRTTHATTDDRGRRRRHPHADPRHRRRPDPPHLLVGRR